MLRFIIIVLFMMAVAAVHGEAPNVRPEENSWPETPQARGISEVMMESPSVMTGACVFNIPLYTVSVEGFSVPLALSYHSNGIRMMDDPQPVGHGWTLTPPLRVSRQVMGRPDELFRSVADKGAEYIRGDYAKGYGCVHDRFACGADAKFCDSQYDIFTIYLIDATLTVVRKDGEFIGACTGEYRIESTDSMGSIKVTDPQGNRYDFATPGSAHSDNIALNDWMLTSITLRSGTVIEFEWQTLSQLVHHLTVDPRCMIYNPLEGFMYDFYERGDKHISRQRGTSRVRSLKSIKFPGGKVECGYVSASHNDMDFTMLDEIKVGNGTETVFRATLTHDTPVLLTKLNVEGYGTYGFTYYPRPDDAHVSSSDWWGFYNGKDNIGDSGYYLSPQIELTDMPGILKEEGADRSVGERSSKSYLLQSVTYPTGGKTTWDYEPHRFNALPSSIGLSPLLSNEEPLTMGGGNRVKSITQTGGDGPRKRTYYYGENRDGLANIEAAPMLSSFVEHNKVCLVRSGAVPGVYEYSVDDRIMVNHQSNYLDDQPGLTPIWYSKVEEVDTEGKMEYEFKMIAPNNIIEKIGGLMPVTGYELHSAFSKGPQMVRKTVYKRDRMAYSKVEEESYDYGMVSNATHPELGFFKVKRVHTVIDGTDAPDHGLYPLELPGHDFSYGHKVVDKGAEFHSMSRAKAKSSNWPQINPDEDARFWFKANDWTLFLATEQLRSTTRSKFLDGGTVTVTERHTYVPGTSLIQSTVVTNGHDSTRTDYSYAYTRSADVSQLMARRNITGMPVTVTETFGKATAGYTLELSAADSTLHPRRVWQIRDGNQWSHNTYTYNKQGFLTAMTTPAGVITRWTRDARGNPTVMDQDNGAIVSKATWKPLVGVTSLTTPNGGKETYTYDACSRLASRAVNSSLMEEYSYSMGLEGNYVMTKKYTSPGVFMRDYAIFDLLGRNHINQSEQPDGTFLSSLTEFDTMGRKWKEWLPVSAGERDSDTALRSAALSHYQDPNPWQETEYEESQRGLALSTTRPGSAWHDDATRKVKVGIRTNSATGWSSVPLYTITSTGVSTTRNHPEATLTMTTTTDEDRNITNSWTDFRGNTILSRQGVSDTHYIYNDHGDLAYVLPPGLSGTHSRSDKEMRELAYWYDYDSRGRLVTRKLPGMREIYYVYDPADRLVAEQSPAMADGQWRVTGYDRLGRQVLTLDCSMTRAQIDAYASTVRSATLDSGPYAGYSLTGITDGGATVVNASYYDNHDFIALLGLPDVFKAKDPEPYERFPVVFPARSAGSLTGTYTGAGHEAYYYDDLGRMIQRYATGFNSGRTTNFYGYRDQIWLTVHEPADEELGGTVIHHDYDSACRPTGTKVTKHMPLPTIELSSVEAAVPAIDRPILPPQIMLGDEISTTMTMSYDAIGQVARTTHGGSVVRDYSHTMQGWLKSAVTSLPGGRTLTETLHYESGSLHPSFTGNISAKEWDTGRYDYLYDCNNRLTEAKFDTRKYGTDFSTTYEYDERGNPLAVTRQGEIDPPSGDNICCGDLDLLTMTYTGNQLTTLNARTNALEFEGQTGVAQNRRFTLVYDSAGRLVKDPSRDIRTIEYDNDSHPVRTLFYDGTEQTEEWDGLGNHLGTTLTTPEGHRSERRYTGAGQIIVDGEATMERTPGGYFDHRERVFRHYITDYQGNNTAIVTDSGAILEQTGYFPYGEPFREPSHPYTFSDNERLHAGGQNQYDFHARRLIPTLLRFDCPDPLMEKKPWNSPYLYCDGNPVMYVDRNGLFSTRAEAEEWAKNNDIELGGDSGNEIIEQDGMFVIKNSKDNTYFIHVPLAGSDAVSGSFCYVKGLTLSMKAFNSDFMRAIIPDSYTMGAGGSLYLSGIGYSISGGVNFTVRGPDASIVPKIVHSETGINERIGLDCGIEFSQTRMYFLGDSNDVTAEQLGVDNKNAYPQYGVNLGVPVAGPYSFNLGVNKIPGANGDVLILSRGLGIGLSPVTFLINGTKPTKL